ncbi:MAG: AraC family transcriptional regulator [Treponema sp.]|nr:AraC family transcriptional regulator [Treponema sp.]
MNTNRELAHALFEQSENEKFHLPYDSEMAFYSAVQSGDEELVKKYMSPLTKEGLGILSRNPLRNMKYHLVITIALITRFCIEGGLPLETSYTLSDLYIRKLDTINNEEEITQIHHDLVFDFTNRMKNIKKRSGLNKSVKLAIDYINNHLYMPLSLPEIAQASNANASYLSSIFKQQTGISISQFIQKQRIETAKNLLAFSDQSFEEISNYLFFSSQSYFISVFKKHVGMTPKEYRRLNYGKRWANT